MNLREIARSGMKGRKKDTLLLKVVITLTFAFVTAAILFQGSTDKTKSEQRKTLYGAWHAAYLGGTEEILEKLSQEPEVDTVSSSIILGTSDKVGVLGTYDEKLQDMGRFTLYKGHFPENENEIAVELNQLSHSGLELEVGQKISVSIVNVTVDEDLTEQMVALSQEYAEQGRASSGNRYHDTPSIKVGDIMVVVSNDYYYYYPMGEVSDPETIRTKGMLQYQEVILQKEFTISGILNTYTDKWDLGEQPAPNAFVSKEAGEQLLKAFYNNGIAKLSEFKMPYNIFLQSESLEGTIYEKLVAAYPDMPKKEVNITKNAASIFLTYGNKLSMDEINQLLAFYESQEEETAGVTEGEKPATSNYRRNTFSFPPNSGSTEYALTLTILGIIFVTTICAVFQIFLTQVKRRIRKIVLLKSIGATKQQILIMILFEGLYLLRAGILFGVTAGFIITGTAITAMNRFGGNAIHFYINYPLLLFGMAAGTAALFIGMMIPTIAAVKVPLVGTMSKPPKHKKIKHKGKGSPKVHYQSFRYISFQYFRMNMGKNMLSFGVATFIISIMLISVFLASYSFSTYNTTVESVNRPSYTMEAIYGESQKYIKEINEELKEIDGVVNTDVFKYGRKLYVWHEGMKENELLNIFKNVLPNSLQGEYFSSADPELKEEEEYISNAIYSEYYAVNNDSELYKHIINSVQEGEVNQESFEKGDEVIVLMPLIKKDSTIQKRKLSYSEITTAVTLEQRMQLVLEKGAGLRTSFDKRYKDTYQFQDTLKPGDILYLSADEEKVVGETIVVSQTSKKVTVGGILYYFMEEGIWPFSGNVNSYTVIGSVTGMETLYAKSRLGLFRLSIEQMKEMVAALYPNSYGRTLWKIETGKVENPEVLDATLLSYANNRGFTLYNYRESNEQLWKEAFNNALVIALLGFTSAAIGFIVLYNTLVSKIEQEKNRIGILQSMGITRSQFVKQYLTEGFLQGIIAIIVSNLLLFLILFIMTIWKVDLSSMDFKGLLYTIKAESLWKYPWLLHGVICLLYLIITVFIQFVPAGRITKLYPVENIRSLGR
ncbi:hypothetical protein acsn021_43210 [Anaerocolumna cellulosilytica]|uniref:ABC3 transporter permease C-terminal domain-containing protein n=1 Tax=Anaerocolumna cellulosilytica TaxID=433286 RepID=A0A6S6RC02_9FIRM|nr:ABC transporter permease [Anaerocolumna cellulosilytica]MBB5195279.1 ABC-type antimicrobial peptide transport system permease subunit [Anaerocolumna cellulosilytica]BCJ96752.1 hypothetical protein acsn021_43210 [Anaerocolumna cellulosilytica]